MDQSIDVADMRCRCTTSSCMTQRTGISFAAAVLPAQVFGSPGVTLELGDIKVIPLGRKKGSALDEGGII